MKSTLITPDYAAFLTEVKGRIHSARLNAGRAVNRELVLLYWDIGRGIVEKQTVEGWGDAVVESPGRDLREEFPDMRGFSALNLWRMRRFVAEHTAPEFPAQVAREVSAPGSKPVPAILSQAVIELVVAVPWGAPHQPAGGRRRPHCPALLSARHGAVRLEPRGAAQPDQGAGKMDFYLNLLNEKERGPDDRPSIGIILCAEKDDVEVEFALTTKANPIGMAEYRLQAKLPAEFKGKLPTAKQLADVVRSVLPEQKQK